MTTYPALDSVLICKKCGRKQYETRISAPSIRYDKSENVIIRRCLCGFEWKECCADNSTPIASNNTIFYHDPKNALKVGLMVSTKEWLEIKEAVSEIQSVLDTVLKDLDKYPFSHWPASEIIKKIEKSLALLEDEANSLLSKLNRML